MGCIYIAFIQSTLQFASHSHTHTHTHTHTPMAAMQGADLTTRSNSGFSILLKDTSTCGQEEPGLKPPCDKWTIRSTCWATATLLRWKLCLELLVRVQYHIRVTGWFGKHTVHLANFPTSVWRAAHIRFAKLFFWEPSRTATQIIRQSWTLF